MRGEWYTTGSSSASGKWLAIGTVAVLLGGFGAVVRIIDAVTGLLWAVFALALLAVALLAVAVVHRARHPRLVRVLPSARELPGPERAALESPAPRELHQHVHNDVHLYVGAGTDPKAVAEIARQIRKDDLS